MAVTGASGSTLTVVRGVNGTTANTHSSGASVFLVSDQRGFVVPANTPPVVDEGAYQSTGINTIPVTSSLSFTGQPASTYLNASLGTVTVTDMDGNTPVAGATITIAISSGALTGARTAVTDAAGTATFSSLSVPATGTYTLTASSSGAMATSNSFTISAGPAVSLVVTTNSDAVSHSGTSLRDAMTAANIDAAAGQIVTITFASNVSGQTITLTQGALSFTGLGAGSVTIDGSAASPLTVSGGGAVEVFNVNTNVTAALSDLTITGGNYGNGENGGGIYNAGTLTLTNDVITGNSASYDGGGIYNVGAASLTDVTLSNNSAPGSSLNGGGGAYNGGTMTVTNSFITGNTTSFNGAGLENAGTMTVADTTFSGNVAGWGALETDNGRSTVIGCTFTANHANDGGGAISLSNSGVPTIVTMIDCTISGNTAQGSGGALWTNNFTNLAVSLVNCTISGNSATTSAGGMFLWSSSTVTTLSNTIVAGDTVGTSASDVLGVISGNNNLIGNGAGMTGITNGTNGNHVGASSSPINPLLNALSANGGPTQTMSEQTGSPAIGAGGVVTTISATLADTMTMTITLANFSHVTASPLPVLTVGSYFTIQIDGEQMAVIGASSYSLTVVRGINGTTAATHASGAAVYVVSDQRGYLVPANSPPIVDIGAYQTTGRVVLPTVTSINPNNGNPSGGTSVVITGANFTGATAVNFGAVAATSFTVNSDSQITAIDPAGTGVVDVTVVTPNGTSATSSFDQFTYDVPTTTSVTSNPVGPITQGTPITFTATISNADPGNVGTVSFYYDYGADDQFQIGGAVSVSSGSATSDATTALPAGADTITAIYSGGTDFDGSQGTLTIHRLFDQRLRSDKLAESRRRGRQMSKPAYGLWKGNEDTRQHQGSQCL